MLGKQAMFCIGHSMIIAFAFFSERGMLSLYYILMLLLIRFAYIMCISGKITFKMPANLRSGLLYMNLIAIMMQNGAIGIMPLKFAISPIVNYFFVIFLSLFSQRNSLSIR